MSINRSPGLTDYLLGNAAPHDILQTVELSQPAGVNGATPEAGPVGTLVCIAAGSPVPNPAELMLTPRFSGFLDKVTKAYDFVILDSSPLLSVVDALELVPMVDGLLVCVRAQQTTRDQARATRGALENIATPRSGAVITGVKRGDPEAYDYYYGY
jgi:Mrp family chromosome partitioning ATPase